jgi:Tol biopolymer transport system component
MPVNAKIKNMGEAINSEYIESNPSVTADGKVLIFSTCRPENTGGLKDPTFGIYYQDIWMSERDSVSGEWMDAEIIRGALNSKDHDASPSISADGNIIFIYKSVNGGDLFYSKKRRNGEWREPEALKGKVNTTYFETSACITADKKNIFFISERPGKGQGNGDIWMATKTGSYEYAEPVNLGNTINSIDDEVSVFVHPDGNTIFFASNGKNSIGGYDIFKSEWKDNKWTTPINLGYPINTLGDEKQFSLTADGKTAYITSHREDTKGEFDIYEIDLSNYVLPDPEGKNQGSSSITSGSISILKGKVLDGKEGTPVEAIVKITNNKGQVIDELETSESGDFLIVLEGDITYTISTKVDGFAPYEEKIIIPKTPGKTETVVKPIFLEDAE